MHQSQPLLTASSSPTPDTFLDIAPATLPRQRKKFELSSTSPSNCMCPPSPNVCIPQSNHPANAAASQMLTIQSLFPKRTSAFAILGPCHGCGTSQTHTSIATFECSLFERLSAHMQADFEAEGQMKFLEDKDIFLSLRLGQIRTDVLDLERKIGSETRGRTAAQRRRDELEREQKELEKLREEIKKALRTGEVNRQVAMLGAAEIESDIKALHMIGDRAEKDQWIRRRLERHVEEVMEDRAKAEELFGPDWEERIDELEGGV
ncbi:hypothetical protein CcaCcLH18_06666 [Colletotrichum camelliae]|nr:hypothetical protein CcaCcLH18_06666 [Colletotrichum camelliae]